MAINANMLIAYLANQRAEPVIQKSSQIADTALGIGNEQLGWAKTQADQLTGIGNKMIGMGEADRAAGAAQADDLSAQSKGMWGRYLSTYVPIELQSAIDSVGGVYADDNTFNTLSEQYAQGIPDATQRAQTLATLRTQRTAMQSGAEQAAGVAAGDVGKAYAAKNADTNRVLSMRGVSPDKLAALTKIGDIQQAADTAGAANAARHTVLREGVGDRVRQVGIGRALAGQATDTAVTATNIRNNAGLPYLQTGAQMFESAGRVRNAPQTWFGTSLNALQTQLGAGQVGIDSMNQALINQMKQGEIERSSKNSMLGGIGSLVGTGLGIAGGLGWKPLG